MDYADTQCHPASELMPKTPTPWLFHEYLASERLANTITEDKCGGKVASVTISVTAPFQGVGYSVWVPNSECVRPLFDIGVSRTRNNDPFG
jgi:hypothetical protein